MFKIPIPNTVHHRHLGPATLRQLGKNISCILFVEVCSQRNLTTIVSSIAPLFRKRFGHLVTKKTTSEISILEQLPIFLSISEKSCRRTAEFYASPVKGYLSPLNPARYFESMCGYYCTCTVCMVVTYSKSMDQPGKVANPGRGQLNRKNEPAYAPENLVSRDGFGSPVLRQPAHLHTQAESGVYFGIPTDFRGGVHLFL